MDATLFKTLFKEMYLNKAFAMTLVKTFFGAFLTTFVATLLTNFINEKGEA